MPTLLALIGCWLLAQPMMIFRRRGTGGYVPPPGVTTRYWVGGAGTWDQVTTTHWSATSGGAGGASVPTATNDVIFDASSGSGTVTCSANAPCNSLTSTASSISLTHNASVTISVGSNSAAGPSGKALDLSGLAAYTVGGGSTSIIAFVSTVASQQTVKYGYNVATQNFNGGGGSWQLISALTGTSTSAQLQLNNGALEINGQVISMGNFISTAAGGAGTRSLTNSGTSTMTLTSTGAGRWDVTGSGTSVASGITVSLATTTIVINGSTGGFRGGGLAYGTVRLTGSGTAVLTGANSYVAFERSNAAACALTMPNGVTQTVALAAGLTISGTSGNLVTITSALAGSAWTLSIASGTTNQNFMSLKDSAATGGATFHAGAGSTNVSGNSGWLFP